MTDLTDFLNIVASARCRGCSVPSNRAASLSPAAASAAGCHRIGPGFAVYAATKHAVLALSEGLRQEVKRYNIRTTVISPGAIATELPNSVTDPVAAERIKKFYSEVAIPADSFARAVAYTMSQPDDVDINEILFRFYHEEC